MIDRPPAAEDCAVGSTRPRGLGVLRALVVLVVVVLALLTRWGWASEQEGPRFAPRPDAIEYAASAQAIAQSGHFYLQIGPDRIRPRYPPGWPLLLAGALRLGLPGERLWQVAGLFGATLAALLALLAMRAVAALTPDGRPAGRSALVVAGLLAGGGWALAPLAVAPGQLVLSDEPAAFWGIVSFLATAAATVPANTLSEGSRGRQGIALLGGLSCGLLASVRPIAAVLLAPALAILAVAALRRSVRRGLKAWVLPWVLGATLVPAATMALLVRSGLPALEWSGYRMWVPQHYARLSDTFQLGYALHGNAELNHDGPHLLLAARTLGGLPAASIDQLLGWFWPLLGWAAAPWLIARARRHGGALARSTPAVAVALGTWTLAHLVAYSLYFFPAARFYLPPAALAVLLFATATALGLGGGFRFPVRALATVVAAAAVIAMTQAALAFRQEPPSPPADADPRNAVRQWLAESDTERARGTVPFDPLYAQALGLLPPSAVAGVASWGRLPATPQVRRLRRGGLLSDPNGSGAGGPAPAPGPARN